MKINFLSRVMIALGVTVAALITPWPFVSFLSAVLPFVFAAGAGYYGLALEAANGATEGEMKRFFNSTVEDAVKNKRIMTILTALAMAAAFFLWPLGIMGAIRGGLIGWFMMWGFGPFIVGFIVASEEIKKEKS